MYRELITIMLAQRSFLIPWNEWFLVGWWMLSVPISRFTVSAQLARPLPSCIGRAVIICNQVKVSLLSKPVSKRHQRILRHFCMHLTSILNSLFNYHNSQSSIKNFWHYTSGYWHGLSHGLFHLDRVMLSVLSTLTVLPKTSDIT